MRSRTLVVLGLILTAAPMLFAETAAPVNCSRLLGWLAGGASTYSLTKAVKNRGSVITLTAQTEADLRSAGAGKDLLSLLRRSQPKISVHDVCPASLAEAAADSHQKKFDVAESIIGGLLESDPHNSALHFALGYFAQQQGQWDEAFDEYSSSKDSDPEFSEVHNRLALFFYQDDDGDDAIGEARTALSMDFNDAEAYRMLALGHYSNEQYGPAMNAFKEALTRDPSNADIYYEMGLVARDQGSSDDAIQFFRKALQLDAKSLAGPQQPGSLARQRQTLRRRPCRTE